MTPQERLALALEYQRKQSDPLDTVPVAGVKQPLTPNEMTWMDRLTNMSAGLGKGIEGQLEGYKQLVTHPVQSAKDTVQALGTMVKNPSVIVDALKGMGEKATSGAQGLGEVVGENMTLNPRKLAMALAHPKVAEMTVYHGTPHTFPAAEGAPLGKFDASKIGTGEGAQSYGHGIYVAESPGVAKEYKNTLSQGRAPLEVSLDGAPFPAPKINYSNPDPAQQQLARIRTLLIQEHGDVDRAIARTYGDDVAALEAMRGRVSVGEPGSFYTVDLPDEHIEKMLDWDKPLSEQPESVRKAIDASKLTEYFGGKEPNANMVYRMFSNQLGGDAAASEAFRKAGIPGIKYLDAGSRDGGKSTRNFVIFPGEEHNLKILERK
jgi:hypothetical protein